MKSETFIPLLPTVRRVADQTEAGKTVRPSILPLGSAELLLAVGRWTPTSPHLEELITAALAVPFGSRKIRESSVGDVRCSFFNLI
jgi:hypothetical protein